MNEVKQVKVDNWGVYFLQRLKHFFNRTDYCDLTLQFQDNAQLKVHRLVLSACTEYFELLERTCEMYEDCLVMPDDLQADVVVPIVNFMYTGQLEFRMDLLERLYLTSQIMNLPVLTKLLESHRQTTPKPTNCYTAKRKASDSGHHSTPSTSHKRSYSKAFESNKEKKVYQSNKTKEDIYATPSILDNKNLNKKYVLGEPRPTRYELPEELDTDNVFDNSFCNISYTSKPLMVHPDTVKRYSSRRSALFGEPSSSKKYTEGTTTMDIVECKKITNDNIFEDNIPDHKSIDESEMFPSFSSLKSPPKDTNQLFDQILDQNDTPKITIDTKNSKISANNLDHAKIISEVLKKYSHLLKGNKNIKLKILNSPNSKPKKQKSQPITVEEKPIQLITEDQDLTFETDVIDSQQAAKLIAMGAENIKGPWICLICGTPGRALHFTTYYKFRRHLVEVHNEKPVVNICEYCGHKAFKRNYLLHHLFSKHGITPPPQYNFPKCNQCNYIALTEGFLVKHKMTHSVDSGFRCNVCASLFSTSHQLLQHIQTTGHKYSADRKNNLQCIYCMKVFLRENNLFAHLKTHHKKEAKSDGIIEDSDEEKPRLRNDGKIDVKLEPVTSNNDNVYEVDVQYQIQADGNIHVITNKKPKTTTSKAKQTILNPEFGTSKQSRKTKAIQNPQPQHVHNEFLQEINVSSASNDEEIVTIDNNEYILKDNQFFPRKMKSQANEEYIISDMIDSDAEHNIHSVTPTTSVDFRSTHSGSFVDNIQQSSVIINKSTNINQPIRFVVSNEEDYKALMAGNHPIIFDNDETNKTLTVLTAPHTTTLDTATIDLDNTQSNDMMIIQEDFPLNVSEAVPSDNSNIVVVYSHPVDSQSKQFQLITTQGLEAQFVQTSAMITQNYETVTTSAPIVNAQVVNSQEVWPNEVHQTLENEDVQTTQNHQIEIIPQTEETEIISHTNTNEADITSEANVSETSLSDLPEVQLITDSTTEVTESQTNETNDIMENNDQDTVTTQVSITVEPTSESIEQEISEDVSSLQPQIDTTVESSVSCEEVVEMATDNIEAIQNICETVSVIKEPISNEISHSDVIEKEPDVMLETSQSSEVQENPQEEIVPSAEQIASPTYTQEESLEINAEPSEQSETVDAVCNNTEVTTPVETNEKIKDLTSEWSEDEYDIPEPNGENENISKELPQSTSGIADNDIEESIENIQQEVDKQMSIVSKENIESQTNGNSSQSSVMIIANGPKESVENLNPDISQEKISSLLNDWEDNDSQGLSSDKIENMQIDSNVDEKIENAEHSETVNNENQNTIKPEDNIKSLVSDWDDDEEEIKN
ncbi:centrosome-associated zinc finger protein CP190 [Manduca sexta]|uniref:Centrosome-associated zinc finger protein CP190 n=1 Tax=Manduca sexta TaxID=7130 RepID=A0A922CP27_MANSE|nr:centrosome-associated zinc finger protein CP190 [Manduca sexta]KAG6453019.1 hypothetical protein O3G_MSEX007940 [Manduca sexta]